MIQRIIRKIVSGGQTGADRAALDAAIEAGVAYGGWLPKGRKTEDGPLPQRYNLNELESSEYRERTRQNVIDSDGTLILSHGELSGGSLLTAQYAGQLGRPYLHVDLHHLTTAEAETAVTGWLADNCVSVLNVAGPRASGDPEIYSAVKKLMARLLATSGSK